MVVTKGLREASGMLALPRENLNVLDFRNVIVGILVDLSIDAAITTPIFK